MSVTCCLLGAETDDAVHDGSCPTIDRTGDRGYIDDQPHPSTGRVIRWRPGPYMTQAEANGHLWRSDRGPYAHCERTGCGLVYPQWDGSACPAQAITPEAKRELASQLLRSASDDEGYSETPPDGTMTA